VAWVIFLKLHITGGITLYTHSDLAATVLCTKCDCIIG